MTVKGPGFRIGGAGTAVGAVDGSRFTVYGYGAEG